jgi:hypothetical protein
MCRRQALAPFGATALQNKLAALGAHTDAEAVRLGAAAIVRLESSLRHTLHLSINVSTEKGKPIEMGSLLSSCRIDAARPARQSLIESDQWSGA